MAKKVSNVVVPSIVEVEVFKTVTPELKYEGQPKSIKWAIEDNSIASIDETTGKITGIALGETKANVTVEDYDGTKIIKEIIERELGRNGQVFYLYNKTSNI